MFGIIHLNDKTHWKLALLRQYLLQVLSANNRVPLVQLSRTMADVGGVSDMRLPYRSAHDVFDVGDLVSREPFKQFTSWFDEASNAPDIGEPNAMALATATK